MSNKLVKWSTYVETFSIKQQELDSVKQLLIEKLQADLDLTTPKLIELHQFPPRAPGEKQPLIAQNELLSSLLAEKDQE